MFEFAITNWKLGSSSIFLKPCFLPYSIIPPYVHTVQSAPDVFSKIVLSASIASSKIFSLDTSPNNLKIAAAPATQHADDDPSPAPNGISELILISIPVSWFLIALFAK